MIQAVLTNDNVVFSEEDDQALQYIVQNVQTNQNNALSVLRSGVIVNKLMPILAPAEDLERWMTSYWGAELPAGYAKLLASYTRNEFLSYLDDGAFTYSYVKRKGMKMLPIQADRMDTLIYLPRTVYKRYDGVVKLPVPDLIQQACQMKKPYIKLLSDAPIYDNHNVRQLGLGLKCTQDGRYSLYAIVDYCRPVKIEVSSDEKWVAWRVETMTSPPDMDRLMKPSNVSSWRKLEGIMPVLSKEQYEYLRFLTHQTGKFRDAVAQYIALKYVAKGVYWNPRKHKIDPASFAESYYLPSSVVYCTMQQIEREYEFFFGKVRSGTPFIKPDFIRYVDRGYPVIFRMSATKKIRSSVKVPLSGNFRKAYGSIERIEIGVPNDDPSLTPVRAIINPVDARGEFTTHIIYTYETNDSVA